MRFREFFPVAAACLSLQGCLEVETRPRPDLEEPPDLSQPDLAPPCAAASGLPGDNLLCVDFSAIPEGSLGASLPAKLTGWAINLNDADKQKYAGVILAIVQAVDLNETRQKIQIQLGLDDPATRLLLQTTGLQPNQRVILDTARAKLPNSGTGMYQPLLKISSTAAAGGLAQGWQIESIAINARRTWRLRTRESPARPAHSNWAPWSLRKVRSIRHDAPGHSRRLRSSVQLAAPA